MPDLLTFTDFFNIGRDEILTQNAKLSREAVEREGSDANVMVASASAMADEVNGQVIDLQAALFLQSAAQVSDQALDNLVFDRYGLIRKPASPSVGSVSFFLPTNNLSPFTIPINTLLQTSGGQQWFTTQAGLFPVGTKGPLVVTAQSVLAGSDQDAQIGTITGIVGTIPNVPTGITVTNQLTTAGGSDAETSDALVARAQQFFVTARRGTISAIESAALSVPGISSATAVEVIDSLGRPARLVQLVVSTPFVDAFADLTQTPPKYPALSQAISTTVFNALSDTRAAGVFVNVIVASIVLQPIQLALAFQAGADVGSVALQARATAVGYVNGLSPGQALDVDAMALLVQQVPGLSPGGVTVVSPVGNVLAGPLQVIRTSLALVAPIAAQTNQPLPTGSNPDSFSLAGG